MKDFSAVSTLLETIKPYKTPKHIIDKAIVTANAVAIPILCIGIILGLIYRYTEPDIDKNTVRVFVDILLLFIYVPYIIAFTVVIYAAIKSICLFTVKLARSDRRFELIKTTLKPKKYPLLQRQQKRDQANVIKLGEELSLDNLKYYAKGYAATINENESWIITIFGNRGAILPILLLVITLTEKINAIASITRFFTMNGQHHPLDFLVVIGIGVIILIVIAVFKQKGMNGKYAYWHKLLQLAVIEQQAIADRKAKEEAKAILLEIKQTQETLLSNIVNKSSQSKWQCLLNIFTQKT